MTNPETPPNPDDPPPRPTTPEFQADVVKTLGDLNGIIATREQQRDLLQRTKDVVDGMTVEESVGDHSAVKYLLSQAQALADIALMLLDDKIDDIETQRDQLAALAVERN